MSKANIVMQIRTSVSSAPSVRARVRPRPRRTVVPAETAAPQYEYRLIFKNPIRPVQTRAPT